jgi:hypothetical protein
MDFNTVLIIPTGIGCEIGGHAGDANTVAKLIGSVSTKLITHPNVVNASDINEMPTNTLYVDGCLLDRFLEGKDNLKEVRSNKILVATNSPLSIDLVNSVNAARVTLGIEAEILVLDTPLEMIATKDEEGKACGIVKGWRELLKQTLELDFDALAISTPIQVDKEVALDYLKNGGVNPWGGVEAKASRMIAGHIFKPVAHAPLDTLENDCLKGFKEIVDPRLSAEFVSCSYIHCVLKGLHKAPIVSFEKEDISNKDVDVMISPNNCWGSPHEACVRNDIPIIIVGDNMPTVSRSIEDGCIRVNSYLEAVGVIQAMKEGISLESLRRPMYSVKII